MKSNFYCFLCWFFLVGCSSTQIVTQNCNNEFDKTLRVGFIAASAEVNTCLAKFNRTDDLILYTNLLKRKITITCDESLTAANLAVAETDTSPNFPGLKIYTAKFSNRNVEADLQTTLAHESLHWLGYDHYANYDLAYIAEMCCLDHKDDFLNDMGKKSCDLFKYKNDDWVEPEYIRNFTEYMGYYGRSFIGIKTSFAAAFRAKKLNVSNEKVFKIFESVAFAMTDGADSNTPLVTKYFASSPAVTQAIVIAYLVEKPDSLHNLQLSRKYLKNKEKKLKFFNLFSQTLKNLIFHTKSELTNSWVNFKKNEAEACKGLEAHEKTALITLATYTYVELFDKVKSTNATLAELRMLDEWTHICGSKNAPLTSS